MKKRRSPASLRRMRRKRARRKFRRPRREPDPLPPSQRLGPLETERDRIRRMLQMEGY